MINIEANNPPTEDVLRMRSEGLPDDKIINDLNSKNKYDPKAIYDAMNQADIKSNVKNNFPHKEELIENEVNKEKSHELLAGLEGIDNEQPEQELYATTPEHEPQQAQQPPVQQAPPQQQFGGYEKPAQEDYNYAGEGNTQVQELIEQVVEEKWEDLLDKISDLNSWRDKMNMEVSSIKQELIRTQQRFELLQKAVLGKVSEYNNNVTNIGTEMQALEQVLQKIIQPLATNVKELGKITESLKKHKK